MFGVAFGAVLVLALGCPPESKESASGVGVSSAIAQRVVSLSPSLTDLVVTLGQGDRLVGVTKHCKAPGVPVVGDMRLSLPKVLKRRPDLVLIGEFGFNVSDRETLKRQGMRHLALRLTTLADLQEAAQLLGSRLDAEAQASRFLESLQAAIAAAREGAAQRSGPKPRVLLVYSLSSGMVFTTGGGDHISELVALAGGVNAASGERLTRRISLARVLSLDPDVIIHVNREGALQDRASARDYWRSMPTLKVNKSGAVFVWPDDSLAQLGGQTPEAIGHMLRLLNGEAP